MNEAKIQLSEEELALVKNADWILTKNKIILKVVELFGKVAKELEYSLYSADLPAEIKLTTPKISKGENYKGLPYVVLDYPRLFRKSEIFAVRILFWWAHYFSVTLQVKGHYREFFEERIRRNAGIFAEHGFYLSVSEDEWVHELEKEHYIPIRESSPERIEEAILTHPFIK